MFNYFSIIFDAKFKLVILVLLTINVVVYAKVGAITSAIDAFAWLMLLVIYEFKMVYPKLISQTAMSWLSKLLGLIILGVFFQYVRDKEWTDVINSALWFTLIVLFELEIRWPGQVLNYRLAYWVATIAVFIGLILIVTILAWQSAWLDAYDAVLWIIAFSCIEVDLMQILRFKS